MALFGKLFQKTPAVPSLRDLQSRVTAAGEDPLKLVRACYDLGVYYMDHSDPARAMLWLSRADTIYSARDEVYEAAGDKLDCSGRIGQLEDAPTLANRITREVEEKAEALSDSQIRLWGLFTMARLAKLGERLGTLPGCGVLGQLYRAVDLVAKSFQEPLSGEEFDQLREIRDRLYELGDSPAFFAGGSLPVSGGAPFQVFDLNGLLTLTELNLYLDSHMTRVDGGEPQGAETGLVPCALLTDYYLRTQEGDIEALPPIQAELERIWSDYALIEARSPIEEILQRVKDYQSLELLA